MANNQSSKMDLDINEITTLPSSSATTSKLPPLRVLSVFNGIGTGYYSLMELGFDVEVFYASEINQIALMLTKYHFSNNIKQLGSVVEITTATLDQIGPINLLIGGSLCADLSRVSFRKKCLINPDENGILFFDYYRIWNYLKVKSATENTPFYWLFENIASMEVKNQEIISTFFECQPIIIDSLHLSLQNLNIYLWSQIPGLANWKIDYLSAKKPKVEDYYEKNLDRKVNVKRIGTITSKKSCLQNGKCSYPASQDVQYTDLYVTEIETIVGLPRHYTDVGDLSIPNRQKVLGRVLSVPVFKGILNLLSDKFAKK